MIRLLAVCGAACALLVATPTGGWAHAILQSTSPADGARLKAGPEGVSLSFNERVSTPPGGIRVFATDGSRVDAGDAGRGGEPSTVQVGLGDGLADGTYITSWRVISADGHPVKGAFLFQVGQAKAADESVIAALLAGGDDTLWGGLAGVGRWLEYAAGLLAAGGVVFLLLVHRGGPGGEARRLRRLVRLAGLAAGVLTLAGIPLQTVLTTGLGAAGLADGAALARTAASSFGASAAVRLAGLALIGVGLARPLRLKVAGGAGAAVVAVSFLLVGHTVTDEPRLLIVGADLAHVGAAAVWFGGLVLLATTLATRDPDGDPVAAAGLVAGFSRLATAAVVVLAAAGVGLAWVEVRAVRALATPYGATLVAKTGLALAVLAVGAYNNRRLVPAITTAARTPVPAGGAGDDPPHPQGPSEVAAGWRRLRRTVTVESLGLMAILLVTAFLVYLQPAREAAGVTGVFSTYTDLGPDHEVNLVVDPNRAGANEIHLYVLDATGRPAEPGQNLTVALTHPDRDIGPLRRTPQDAGPGHWLHVGPELSIPGRWMVEVVLRISDFEELRTRIPVVVNP